MTLEPMVKITYDESKGAKIRNRYNQVPHLTQDVKACNARLLLHFLSKDVHFDITIAYGM